MSISGRSSSCSTVTSSPASLTTALKPNFFATAIATSLGMFWLIVAIVPILISSLMTSLAGTIIDVASSCTVKRSGISIVSRLRSGASLRRVGPFFLRCRSFSSSSSVSRSFLAAALSSRERGTFAGPAGGWRRAPRSRARRARPGIGRNGTVAGGPASDGRRGGGRALSARGRLGREQPGPGAGRRPDAVRCRDAARPRGARPPAVAWAALSRPRADRRELGAAWGSAPRARPEPRPWAQPSPLRGAAGAAGGAAGACGSTFFLAAPPLPEAGLSSTLRTRSAIWSGTTLSWFLASKTPPRRSLKSEISSFEVSPTSFASSKIRTFPVAKLHTSMRRAHRRLQSLEGAEPSSDPGRPASRSRACALAHASGCHGRSYRLNHSTTRILPATDASPG